MSAASRLDDGTFVRRCGGGGGGGGAAPLLLVHGGPGMDHGYLVPGFARCAAGGRSLYLYDQVGCGRDPRPPDQVTLARLARQLTEVARFAASETGRPPRLVGHSFGCFLALHAAPWRDGVADAAPVLVSPMELTWAELLRAEARFMRGFSTAEAARIEALEREGTAEAGRQLQALLFPRRLSPRAACRVPAPDYRPAVSVAVWAELEGYDLRDRLAEVAGGAVLVFGADDPARHGDFHVGGGAGGAGGIRTVVVADAGHYPFLEQPVAFHRALRPLVCAAR